MIRESVSLTDVFSFLNELVAMDPKAVELLIEHRVPCNEALANHPTVQVRGNSTVGFLGALNGLFGAYGDGWGSIAAVFEDDGRLVGFERVPQTYWACTECGHVSTSIAPTAPVCPECHVLMAAVDRDI